MLLYTRSINHLIFLLVVKPTVPPTLPPTPPPPPTIPAALEGKNNTVDFPDEPLVHSFFFLFF